MNVSFFRGFGSAALLCVTLKLGATPPPSELNEALANFRAEGAKGWAFVQTTKSAGEVQVERFDPAQPDFNRWTLLKKEGRTPTNKEIENYREAQTRRSSAFNAPRIQDLLDLSTATFLPSEASHPQWRFRLKPGEADDKTAEFISVTLTVDRSSRTVERVEMTNLAPFSPSFGISIDETKTVMLYSLPTDKTPSLLQAVTLHIRGRAFWVKSLNQDMTLEFSDHTWAGKKSL